ncbi:MAG: ABC transporter substrate-binding protein [Thermomicrobiales bacterium]|jgi:peptide/nickel transport system substrate-binding protein
MDTMSRLQGILSNGVPVSRRDVLKRGAVITVSVPVVASLLAACGGSSNEKAATSTPSEARPTATQGVVPTTGTGGGGGSASPTTSASPEAGGGAGTPIKGGTMVVQGHQEIASLHPDDQGPTVHYVMIRAIHEPLIDLDYDYQIVPILAESYEAAPDGTKYTFKMHSGVTWQDGQPLTSKDAKYNVDWYKDPANAAVMGSDFAEVGDVETPDDTTIVINMTKVNAAFLAGVMPAMMLVPEHIQSKTGKDNYTSQATGTGPFKLKEWVAAEQTTLEAYDNYWGGRANIDTYREEVVPEGSVRAIALRTGKSDFAVWPVQAEDNLKFIQEAKFDVNRAAGTAVNHFPLNNQKPSLSDKVVRQAMMTAIDRDRLINDLEKGLAVKATANLSPAVVFFYNPDVTKYDHNPDAAKKLLDDAGYAPGSDGIREKNGVKLTFTCTVITGDQRRRPEAEVVQQDLKAIGIDMQIDEKPVATILDGLPKGTLDASLFNWTYGVSEPDARTTLRSDASRNFSSYRNPEMDKLLDDGVHTVDPTERQRIYKEIQAIIAEDVPFLYIMFWEDIGVWNKRIQGRPKHANNSTFYYANVYKFWIDESLDSSKA